MGFQDRVDSLVVAREKAQVSQMPTQIEEGVDAGASIAEECGDRAG
jgi:hypothetical protein